MKIGKKHIGEDNRIFIIAELSANHGHDIEIAKKTILAAKEAGADCIKLQTYTADTMTIDCHNEYFTINQGTIWDGQNFYELYEKAYTPWEWHKRLIDYANKLGMECFSTPFDISAVDFLEELDVVAYKVASFEITDTQLIKYIAKKGKPVIISTGIASLSEIEEAVNICREVGNDQIVLLKCTSSYPAKAEDANLSTLKNMGELFDVEVGVSDHSIGLAVPIISTALGASIIEKHIILDSQIGGPDASFSLDFNQFKDMVLNVREAESAIGVVDYSMSEKKLENRLIARSLFVVKDIKKGERFTEENVRSIRPGHGLSPKYLATLIGKKAKIAIIRGEPMKWEYIEE